MMEKKKTISHEERAYRRKRVRRLKKILLGTAIVLVVVPTICCIGLLYRIKQLETQVEQLVSVQSSKIEELLYDFDISFCSTVIHAADVVGKSVVFEEDKDNSEGKADFDKEEAEKGSEDEGELTYEEQLDKSIKKGKVYLTFDDGPGPYTDELLDVLAEYDVKATFFVIGRKDEHSLKMYKRIVEEGHTLAMHTYTHQYEKIYSSVKAFKKDLNKLSNLLYEATGEKPKYFRFPGGSSNSVSSLPMADFIAYLNKKDIVYFDWNVINGDATGKDMTAKQMVSMVMSGVRKNNNSIVLMHDSVSKDTTVKSLPSLIKKLQKEDYVILPITKYTKPIQHIDAGSVE